MSLDNVALFLSSQRLKDYPQRLANFPEHCFTSVPGSKYQVALAILFRMRQDSIHLGFSCGCALPNHCGRDFTPGTIKALLDALVEPVAYLNCLIICRCYRSSFSASATLASILMLHQKLITWNTDNLKHCMSYRYTLTFNGINLSIQKT
jgi:hypothetical protein